MTPSPPRLAQARRIILQRRIQGEWTLTTLRHLIEQVSRYDLSVESHAKWWRRILTVLVVLCLLAGLAGWGMKEFVLLGLAGALAALGAGVIVLLTRLEERDLGNELRDYLAPLMRYLGADVRRQGRIALSMALDPPIQPRYLVEKVARAAPPPPYHECIDHHYQRPLFSLALPLHDGNHLLLTGRERIVRSDLAKRNAANKRRTKTKLRKAVTFRLRLTVNARQFRIDEARLAANQDPTRKLACRPGHHHPVLTLGYTEKMAAEQTPDPMLTLHHLTTLYGCLQPAAPLSPLPRVAPCPAA